MMGGYARLKTAIEQECARCDGPWLLLDGGDEFQGSGPAAWSEGEAVLDPLNAFGIDVSRPAAPRDSSRPWPGRNARSSSSSVSRSTCLSAALRSSWDRTGRTSGPLHELPGHRALGDRSERGAVLAADWQ